MKSNLDFDLDLKSGIDRGKRKMPEFMTEAHWKMVAKIVALSYLKGYCHAGLDITPTIHKKVTRLLTRETTEADWEAFNQNGLDFMKEIRSRQIEASIDFDDAVDKLWPEVGKE